MVTQVTRVCADAGTSRTEEPKAKAAATANADGSWTVATADNRTYNLQPGQRIQVDDNTVIIANQDGSLSVEENGEEVRRIPAYEPPADTATADAGTDDSSVTDDASPDAAPPSTAEEASGANASDESDAAASTQTTEVIVEADGFAEAKVINEDGTTDTTNPTPRSMPSALRATPDQPPETTNPTPAPAPAGLRATPDTTNPTPATGDSSSIT